MFDYLSQLFWDMYWLVQWMLATFSSAIRWLGDTLSMLSGWISQFAGWVWDALKFAGEWIVRAARTVWKGLSALGHLDFRKIWGAIKRGYERLRRALDWYMRTIQRPLDQIRQRIWEIYRRFFQPILRFLDSLRVFTRALALFNRKLAMKLDSKLWNLEAKLLWPITQMLKRVNSLSSYMRAYITRLGLLDRTLLLESLRRDALLVWEVLTNPRARLFAPVARWKPVGISGVQSNFRQFLDSDTGPVADGARSLENHFRETMLLLE